MNKEPSVQLNDVSVTEFNPRPTAESEPTPKAGFKDMRVAGHSSAKDLAGSISKTYRGGQKVRMHAIGSQAVCQATKAIPIANSYLAPQGIFLVAKVYFMDKQIEVEGGESVARTSMIFELLPLDM